MLDSPASEILQRYLHSNHKKDGIAYFRNGTDDDLFCEPVMRVWADSHGSYCQTAGGVECYNGLWEAISDQFQNALSAAKSVPNSAGLPCAAGYFSYELSHSLEELKKPELGVLNLPYYEFFIFRKLLRFTHETLKVFEFSFTPELNRPLWTLENPSQELAPVALKNSAPLEEIQTRLAPFSNFTRKEYVNAIFSAKEKIRRGDIYQVNLSQRFKIPYDHGEFELFRNLNAVSPAPYQAFFQLTSGAIISSSPERFLEKRGDLVFTSPIKGTLLKTDEAGEGESLLLKSEKNSSELMMITDIERNDLSKIAEPGSVQVTNLMRLQTTRQLEHTVSDVKCRVRPDASLCDIIKALFPSGSVTGAPKISAMNSITELERIGRGVYTGTIGSLAPNGDFTFNVAIRTAFTAGGYLYYSAGGGIVYDSDPESEYDETLAKAKGFYIALKSLGKV